MNIEEKVIEFVLQGSRNKNSVAEDIRETRLIEDLGYDSLVLISLFMEMEEEFDFEIEDVDLINAMTIGHLIDICSKNVTK
jgi:acyl carrier protein